MSDTSNNKKSQGDKKYKVINLKYEYEGYAGNEKWAIISELSEKELFEQYPDKMQRYSPFVLLSVEQGKVISEYAQNEDKYRKRNLNNEDWFGYSEGLTENLHTRRLDDDSSVYLIDRYSLATSANSLISAAEKLNLTGIGLSTLSSVAYSDYSTEEYYCKAHMSDDVNSILTSLAEKDIKTFGESANDYAAAKLDYVFNTPSGTSAYYGLDMELPFYQMVFRGYSAISGAVINLSPDSDKEYLNSVLTGCSLAFTLSDHMVTELSVMEANSAIGASIYQGLSNDIKNYIRSAQPLYEALGGAAVEAFERDGDLAATIFSNGVKVVVNYSDNDIETEMGTVKAKSFIFSGKAGENR